MKRMIKSGIGIGLICIAVLFTGCLNEMEMSGELLREVSLFDTDNEGWLAGFSGFPVEMEDSMKLEYLHEPVYVSESIGSVTAIKQKGYAANSNLFMFVKQQISGLRPNSRYLVTFELELIAQLLEDYQGNLGNKEQGSFLKVGAFKKEPSTTSAQDVLNANISVVATDFDKGDISQDGEDMVLIGKVEYSIPGQMPIIIHGNNLDKLIYAVSDDEGKVWVAVGVDTNIPVYLAVSYTFIVIHFEFQNSV